MTRFEGRRAFRWVSLGLVLWGLGATPVWAQRVPTAEPLGAQPPPAPAGPPVPALVGPPAGLSREAQLEERIRQLEATVNRLSSLMEPRSGPPGPSGGGAVSPNIAPGATAPPNVPSPASAVAPSGTGGVGSPGQSLPPNPPPTNRFNQPATLESLKANTRFGPGFEIRSEDDEYIMQFHDLTQFDYRGYQQGGQIAIKDTFTFPRQWYMFSGRFGKPFGYFVSIANGFDTFSILDVFLDIEYDPRFRIRAGRFKTPFTYEFFVEPIQGLVTTERSLFFNNFALNRDLGVMVYGRLFGEQLDYATGIFNGDRNQLIDQDNSKSVAAFMNWRPFGDEQETLLENLNIGGSVYAGTQHHVPVPQTFRTIVPTTGNSAFGVPFLGLNSNVVDSGMQAFWDLHAAWFYQQWAVIGEWGSGFETYALAGTTNARTQLPVQSFYAQASYLLTGETRSSIGIVKPNRPFDIRAGKRGPGALEPFVRVQYLDISNKIFSNGFADPNLWTNRLYDVTLGLNWHLTQYLKMYFDWYYDGFAQPVIFAPGRRQGASNTFMARLQLFF